MDPLIFYGLHLSSSYLFFPNQLSVFSIDLAMPSVIVAWLPTPLPMSVSPRTCIAPKLEAELTWLRLKFINKA